MDHVIYHPGMSLLEMDRIGDFSMLFLLFPSTEMACCHKRLSRVQWSGAGRQCWV